MKFLISILLSAVCITSVLAGGPSVSPSSPCADTVWPGQCFNEGSQLTSCNGNWIFAFVSGVMTLTDSSISKVYTVFKNPTPFSCEISICINSSGVLKLSACGFNYDVQGVASAKVEDNGSITLYDSAGAVVYSQPPSFWLSIYPETSASNAP